MLTEDQIKEEIVRAYYFKPTFFHTHDIKLPEIAGYVSALVGALSGRVSDGKEQDWDVLTSLGLPCHKGANGCPEFDETWLKKHNLYEFIQKLDKELPK